MLADRKSLWMILTAVAHVLSFIKVIAVFDRYCYREQASPENLISLSVIMIPWQLARVGRTFLFGVVLLGAFVVEVHASGSYMVRPILPPGHLLEESQRYELGKAIFFGRAPLKEPANVDRAAQRNLLTGLQDRLPTRVKRTVDLPNLSGKLSDEQLSALQHFLRVRHKIY